MPQSPNSNQIASEKKTDFWDKVKGGGDFVHSMNLKKKFTQSLMIKKPKRSLILDIYWPSLKIKIATEVGTIALALKFIRKSQEAGWLAGYRWEGQPRMRESYAHLWQPERYHTLDVSDTMQRSHSSVQPLHSVPQAGQK